MLTGEELTCLVLDIGSHTIKIGLSGEDQPRIVVHNYIGHNGNKLYFDELSIAHSIGQEIRQITSIGDLSPLLDFQISKRLGVKWSEFPVLIAESIHWTKEWKEQLIRLFFDQFEVPAIYFCKAPILAAFAVGKHTALVIDCGSAHTTISAVFEGYMIKNSNAISIGGSQLNEQVRFLLEKDLKIPLYIHQEIAKKDLVELGNPSNPELIKNSSITKSFRKYHIDRLLEEFKESCIQINEQPFNEANLARRPPKYFEFPDGHNRVFGLEKFRLGEYLFAPEKFTYFPLSTSNSGGSIIGITDAITQCINHVDADMRSALVGNIVLTGSSSLINGMQERLAFELAKIPTIGSSKLKIHSTTSNEKKFGPWIGASILGSINSFHQLWFTRQEYREHGAQYIDKKCLQ